MKRKKNLKIVVDMEYKEVCKGGMKAVNEPLALHCRGSVVQRHLM